MNNISLFKLKVWSKISTLALKKEAAEHKKLLNRMSRVAEDKASAIEAADKKMAEAKEE